MRETPAEAPVAVVETVTPAAPVRAWEGPEAPTDVDQAEFHTTESGLEWATLAPGSGPTPELGQLATIRFAMWSAEGAPLDATPLHRPFQFTVGSGGVIAGMNEGVATMQVGERRQLRIPADLGYRNNGSSLVPPDTDLVVELQLEGLSRPRVAPEAPSVVDPEQWVESESGLRYADLAPGAGGGLHSGDTIHVDYAGFLEDGTRFDSSWSRSTPLRLTLGKRQVIPGWEQGLAGMAVGGRRQLVIPPALAYGDAGWQEVIPPGATLVFDVEIVARLD